MKPEKHKIDEDQEKNKVFNQICNQKPETALPHNGQNLDHQSSGSHIDK